MAKKTNRNGGALDRRLERKFFELVRNMILNNGPSQDTTAVCRTILQEMTDAGASSATVALMGRQLIVQRMILAHCIWSLPSARAAYADWESVAPVTWHRDAFLIRTMLAEILAHHGLLDEAVATLSALRDVLVVQVDDDVPDDTGVTGSQYMAAIDRMWKELKLG